MPLAGCKNCLPPVKIIISSLSTIANTSDTKDHTKPLNVLLVLNAYAVLIVEETQILNGHLAEVVGVLMQIFP